MIKEHLRSEIGSHIQTPHGLLFSIRLAARDRLYALFHRQDSTYHGVCNTSRRAPAGTRNGSMCRTMSFEVIKLHSLVFQIVIGKCVLSEYLSVSLSVCLSVYQYLSTYYRNKQG